MILKEDGNENFNYNFFQTWVSPKPITRIMEFFEVIIEWKELCTIILSPLTHMSIPMVDICLNDDQNRQ